MLPDAHSSFAARADYCGATAYTKDGSAIEIHGELAVAASGPDASFEAAWGPSGAVCVSEPRYHELVDGEEQLPSCWAALPRCDSFAEAEPLGARVANASTHEDRNLCAPRQGT